MSQEKISRVQKYNTEVIKKIEIENVPVDNDENNHHLSFMNKLILYLFLIIILIITYSTLISPHLFKVKEYKIEDINIPYSMNGLKIVHFSDIHYGNSINKKQLEKIVTNINNLKPDIIIFTGDLISKDIEIDDKIKNEVIDSLSKLECTIQKYAIFGDEDTEYYDEIMDEIDFTLLDNNSKFLFYQGEIPIVITGIGSKNRQDYTTLNAPINDKDILSYYQIVLIHEPDTVDNFLNYNPNLILGGHTLGGSIRLPYLKPLFLPEDGLKYYEDFYELNQSKLYISSGLGTSSLNMRLNNQPSINLYRLYTPKESN